MPFPYDKYPWLNFQELNLAYFIKHFREIFQQWDQLYHDLLHWKDATDADLAEWKSAVESGIASWESGLTASLEEWKTQTEADIGTWEAATLAALDAWKTSTTLVFEQIRTEAAASATAAAGSAAAAETAKTAAQTAQAAAETAAAGISSSLAQISENTLAISDLERAVGSMTAFRETLEFTNGGFYRLDVGIGGTTNQNPTASADWAYIRTACAEGDMFDLDVQASSAALPWGFIDSDRKLLTVCSTLTYDGTITAPANSAFLIVNQKLSSGTGTAAKISGTDNFANLTQAVSDLEQDTDSLDTRLTAAENEIYDITGGDNIRQIDLTDPDVINSNAYVSIGGEIRNANGFDYTDPIHVLAGDIVTAKVKSYNAGLQVNKPAILSSYDSQTLTYTCLVETSSADYTTYTYTVPSDMDIVCSFLRFADNELTISHHVDGALDNFAALIHPDSVWVCFGDSITGREYPTSIPDKMRERFRGTVYNVGFPGSRANQRETTAYRYFDLEAIADAIDTNDFTDQDANVGDTVAIYTERLATLKAIDFSTVTNAYFLYGINDFNSSQTIAVTVNALINSIKKITAKYPNITPVIITPLFRFKIENNTVIFIDEWTNNVEISTGVYATLIDYINAIAASGKANFIPAINLLETLGITKSNYTKYFDISDGTHPSNDGIQIIGGNIAAMLDYLN